MRPNIPLRRSVKSTLVGCLLIILRGTIKPFSMRLESSSKGFVGLLWHETALLDPDSFHRARVSFPIIKTSCLLLAHAAAFLE